MSHPIPQKLHEAFAEKRLIPIVGAGVSMSLKNLSGETLFPSWADLLERAAKYLTDNGLADHADEIRSLLKRNKYQKAANVVREGLLGSLWRDFFTNIFSVKSSEIEDASLALPRAIWKLSERIITLNYDRVLRFACPSSNDLLELDNFQRDSLADFKNARLRGPAVWHLHGRLESVDKLIFAKDRYEKLYLENDENFAAALSTLRELCSSAHFLFVGCGLDDAELLSQLIREHKLFDGNAGPHYALVREEQIELVRAKLSGMPIQLLGFSDFGAPLIAKIEEIAAGKSSPSGSGSAGTAVPSASVAALGAGTGSAGATPHVGKRVAVLTANPIDSHFDYSDFHTELNGFKCELCHFPLSVKALQELEQFDYIFILSRMVRKQLLIEGDALQSEHISLKELEEQIGNDETLGLFILLNQEHGAELDPSDRDRLTLPTLILPGLRKEQIKSLGFKLFKKKTLEIDARATLCNGGRFKLCEMKGEPDIQKKQSPLSELIDAKNTRNFVGRRTDLVNLCRMLLNSRHKNQLLSIKGSGGIGKTMTIKKIAVELAKRHFFKDGIAFIDCEFIPDYPTFLQKLAAHFGLEHALEIKQHFMNVKRQDKLLILDNAETLLYLADQEQIKDFMAFICDYASIVVTTRETLNLDCEQLYELRSFTTDEAFELFVQKLGNRKLNEDEKRFIRQELVENLLDNNPLAITLVAKNIPDAKSMSEVRDDLKQDFFRKISDADLAVFDRVSDTNIERKKSLYASIHFSYQHLKDGEKLAFELLSLFPDGIDIRTLQQIAQPKRGKTTERGRSPDPLAPPKPGPPPQALITDGIIKSLEDKSLTQVDNHLIKLQSIIGKFAEHQWSKRTDQQRASSYRNAIGYHFAFANSLKELARKDLYSSAKNFHAQQGNFLKSIAYIDAVKTDQARLLNYFNELLDLSISCSTTAVLAHELEKKWSGSFSEEPESQLCFELILLRAKYYAGEFDIAFQQLKELMPLEELSSKWPKTWVENLSLINALNIYQMEGEAFFNLKYRAKMHWFDPLDYPIHLYQLGVVDQALLACSPVGFYTLEAQLASCKLTEAMMDKYIASLYPENHIQIMQTQYLKAKLSLESEKALDLKQIKELVSVNPFTLGLQQVMLALATSDDQAKIALFEQALPNLAHIKYYYVEALLLYARFLERSGRSQEFLCIQKRGLELATQHHYRWLRYQLEALCEEKTAPFTPETYPLPEDLQLDGYIKYLIKQPKHWN